MRRHSLAMSNDSPFPAGEWDRLAEDGVLCQVLCELRAYEQSRRQDEDWDRKVRNSTHRHKRRVSARPAVVDLADYR